MIEFHKLKDDALSADIEEKLREMVLAYRTVVHEPGESTGRHLLPYIREGETVINGEKPIKEFLHKLESELRYQRSLTGDGCYIDPDTGDVC